MQYLLAPGPDYPHSGWNGISNAGAAEAFLARPADTLLFVDVSTPADTTALWSYAQRPGDAGDANGMGRVHLRHHGRANAAFCDGHVQSMSSTIADAAGEARYWDPR